MSVNEVNLLQEVINLEKELHVMKQNFAHYVNEGKPATEEEQEQFDKNAIEALKEKYSGLDLFRE